MTVKYHIALTEQEQALLKRIDLRACHPTHDEGRAAYLANQEPILALLKSLSERDAVPRERLNYWNDPRYYTGRLKASNKGAFERNGCIGSEIYTHPHFIPYLRYFLFGPDLPDAVIAGFEEKVGNPDWVTSSDITPISKYARDQARQHRLDRSSAPEEFFKLCLDIGLGLSVAAIVRRSVMQLR
jgi:hypothetical protein